MPTKIIARTNGPLLIEGDGIDIVDQNGKEFHAPNPAKFALCRCGGSANKPFCDGTHSKNGFTCPAQP
jgi:CDGSH-type Zn-finger protein